MYINHSVFEPYLFFISGCDKQQSFGSFVFYKHQTPNTKHQTANTKQQTPNTKHQTPNTKHQTPNTTFITLKIQREYLLD